MFALSKRQDDNLGYDGYSGYDSYYSSDDCYQEGRCSWWWSNAGHAVRYTIVAVLFFIIFAYFLGGYWHARRRLRKNLPPLAYHRWMVKRYTHPRYYTPHGVPVYVHQHPQQNPYYGQPQHPDYYGMQGSSHAPPPPAYHAGDAPPPVYQPPQGSSKVAADQNYTEARVGESSELQAPGAAARPS